MCWVGGGGGCNVVGEMYQVIFLNQWVKCSYLIFVNFYLVNFKMIKDKLKFFGKYEIIREIRCEFCIF